MVVNDELIEKLENLAKLKLNATEKVAMKSQLEVMIGMFSKISEVNTDHVKPLIHITDAVNQYHEDFPMTNLSTAAALSLAPKAIDAFFSVPKVIE